MPKMQQPNYIYWIGHLTKSVRKAPLDHNQGSINQTLSPRWQQPSCQILQFTKNSESQHPLQTYCICMWHIYLQITQISNQNSSNILWQQFLICQRQQRISQISQRTKGSSRCQCPFHQHFSTSSPWRHKQEIYRTINQKETEHFLGNTCFIPKDKVISLLELVVNNCVFSFLENSTNTSKDLQWVSMYLQSLLTFTWHTLKD